MINRARQSRRTHKARLAHRKPEAKLPTDRQPKPVYISIPYYTDNTARESGPASVPSPPTPPGAGPHNQAE